MNNNFIPQMEPWFGSEEKEAMNKYLTDGGWITEFKQTESFEHSIADYVGSKHCIVVNNGTVSLTLAALAAGTDFQKEINFENRKVALVIIATGIFFALLLTLFINDFKSYDVIVGMYHDQVLTPFKTIFKFDAINITLGLNYLRVSPDHGVAKDLILKNKANPKSLIECIKFINKFGL